MSEAHARDSRFGYKENSNLVLSGGRSGRRISDDPRQKGEVESLYNKTDGMRFGDRGELCVLTIAAAPHLSDSNSRFHGCCSPFILSLLLSPPSFIHFRLLLTTFPPTPQSQKWNR